MKKTHVSHFHKGERGSSQSGWPVPVSDPWGSACSSCQAPTPWSQHVVDTLWIGPHEGMLNHVEDGNFDEDVEDEGVLN